MLSFVLAWYYHGVCFGIVNCPLPKIKVDPNLVPTESFFVFQVGDDVRNAYKKNCQQNPRGRQLLKKFAGGNNISGLKGKRVGNYLQQK